MQRARLVAPRAGQFFESILWKFWCLTGLACLWMYFVSPEGFQRVLLPTFNIAAGVLVLTVGPSQATDSGRHWRRLGWGTVLLGLGNLLMNAPALGTGGAGMAPLVFSALGYVFHAVAIVGFVRLRADVDPRSVALDALIAIAGTAALWWVLLVQPLLSSPKPLFERLFSLSFPFADVVLIGLLAALLVTRRRHCPSLLLLAGALFSTLLADGLRVWPALTEGYAVGGVVDVGWLCGYILLGAAVLHPSVDTMTEVVEGEASDLGRRRLHLFTLAAATGPAFLGLVAVLDRPVDPGPLLLSSPALVLLILVRLHSLMRRVEHHVAELDASKQALHDEELRYRKLVEQTPAVNYTDAIDDVSTPLYVSPRIHTLVGYTVEEWMAQPELWLEAVHPEDRERVIAEHQRTNADLVPFSAEYRMVHREGHIVWVLDEAEIVYDEDGLPRCWNGLWLDITSQKRAETALRNSEARSRAMLESALDCVIVADEEGRILEFNPAAERTFGYDKEEAVGQVLGKVVVPPSLRELHREGLARYVGNGEGLMLGKRVELIGMRADGSEFPIELSLNVAPLEEGRVFTAYIRDITDRKRLESELAHQAFYDSLTGLGNRVLFTERVDNALARNERRDDDFAVLFIDLDEFKTVNDSMGHSTGDSLLAEIAKRLSDAIRPGDTVARLGGDEFGVLLEDVNPQTAQDVAARILRALGEPIMLRGRELHISASVGIALGSGGLHTAGDVLRNADLAMYKAKGKGKGLVAMFEASLHVDLLRRVQLESSLKLALERRELFLAFQPIVNLASGRVVGTEALVRWREPERGVVLPGEFIPVAEQSGLIVPLGEQVLRDGCEQVVSWIAAHRGSSGDGFEPPTMSVNLSSHQLRDERLVPTIERVLEETGCPASSLLLEITESALLEDKDWSVRQLERLKACGVRLAIDDFGTGYSSLAYLSRFPFDVLKIDRSFVRNIETDPGAASLLKAVVELAQALDLMPIAEGVETAGQAQVVRDLGCRHAQGFFFYRPMSPELVEPLLASSESPLPVG